MSKQIIIVDKSDKIIGYRSSQGMNAKDIYRVSALWLTNSKGDILLARRALNKKHHPYKWGPAVVGTLEKGEDYDSNIVKEAEEEIGLKDIKFNKGPKKFNLSDYIHYTQWYTAVVDKDSEDFIIEPKEVAGVRWFTKKEIEEKLINEPDFFIPNLQHYFKLFK
ncbi:MAG: hypothetical protein COV55_03225 [Candidatus Komeilibacteria bacterium CG11_big_fil_rev_8_21_14_0_20_36_20]|uniref:Nudix hydrolase domain-containing protein n=1 Tax=Candidatus Komeilibacteria bacterium CG11_big_fil_rev_8_21_14_0_20_36_20 TaxID=1974477 RepID=A0A2H0NCA3_9BACT|nr:MAG: hypothetical protein COV55_03225 [Candidatus Komeilibacteria bacterium CG11_big_fil_rev_8_21_14_0_20_36_20]PIR81784.1 MAG: hypothetical protein COU21_01965 [Candidatus Komeilibacteria bacterium CG10_big_fil_rev_8_21_14_0_10_36_65]PJC55795.1 MAG: hypothetical protein CO027_00065 [Candidatus Komeilibacteria bacterium CG_4_9_14_0_2_um_filter_36_13]